MGRELLNHCFLGQKQLQITRIKEHSLKHKVIVTQRVKSIMEYCIKQAINMIVINPKEGIQARVINVCSKKGRQLTDVCQTGSSVTRKRMKLHQPR